MDAKGVRTGRLVQASENGRLSRRQMNTALTSVGLMSFGMVFGPKVAGAAAEDNPSVFTWSGYDDDGFMGAYIETYGERPNFSFWGDEEEAFAKMRAGFEPDITAPCSYKLNHWNAPGLLAEIDTDRLRHVAFIGVRARPYSYSVRGKEAPEATIRVELTSPSGETWVLGDPDATDVVRGTATDFCRVATQRRPVSDTNLAVPGAAAKEGVESAPACAGPPGPGRRPGQFAPEKQA